MFKKLAVAASLMLVGSACAWAQSSDRIVIKVAYGTAGGADPRGARWNSRSAWKAPTAGSRFRVFPGGQLGSEGEIIDQLQTGMTDMLMTHDRAAGPAEPDLLRAENAVHLHQRGAADKVLDGPAGAKLLKGLEAKGLVGLTFWENGFREMTNNTRPIKTPADLKGLKDACGRSRTACT